MRAPVLDPTSRGELRGDGVRPGAGLLEQGAIKNAVNFPNVEMPREAPHRVANANVPNMLGQRWKAGLNIHNMVNKSRGEMAYTLVDVDSGVDDALVRSIAAIDGVPSVRAIPAQASDSLSFGNRAR